MEAERCLWRPIVSCGSGGGQAAVLILVCAVEGNSCGSTRNQLKADVSAARLTPAGVYVSAPLQETEGGGGRQAQRDGEAVGGCLYAAYLKDRVVLYRKRKTHQRWLLVEEIGCKLSSSYR